MSELYEPIRFPAGENTDRKNPPTNDAELHHPIEVKDKRPDEKPFTEDYKPSFCHGPDPKELSSSASPEKDIPRYTPQVPLPVPYATPTTFNLPIPLPLSKKEKSQVSLRESRSKSPTAYDIAVALMNAQPLRMRGDALFAYEGRYYKFVNESTMHRLIMQQCRPFVQAIGDASIIKKVYDIIKAEPNICIPPITGVPLVALDDGLLDLTTLAMGQFSPDPFVTVRLKGNYAKGQFATCPTFEAFLSNVTSVPSGQNSKDYGIKSCKFNSGIAGSKLPIDFSGDRITANRPYPNLFLEAVEIRRRLG